MEKATCIGFYSLRLVASSDARVSEAILMAGKRKQAMGEPGRHFPELPFDPIVAALRQLHDQIAAEKIPDDFMKLLEKLDKMPAKQRSN